MERNLNEPNLNYETEVKITIEDKTTGSQTHSQISFLRDDPEIMAKRIYILVGELLKDLGLSLEGDKNERREERTESSSATAGSGFELATPRGE
jgi:hypothetical protein